jgi:methylmalonyl-CoA mutase N-terminal domain/subunit
MEAIEKVVPTEAQIKQTIQDLKARLADVAMNKPINRAIREGYSEVLDILVEDRRTYDGIDKLSTVQGRAIAVLGVDWLNGECTKQVLMGVPLK